MSGYFDLDVYQRAHEMGVRLHTFSLRLPKYEIYESSSQLRRSSKAISANIVEGYGRRRYPSDYLRFLTYAHASADETREWLQYIQDCHPHLADDAVAFVPTVETVGRQLHGLIRSTE